MPCPPLVRSQRLCPLGGATGGTALKIKKIINLIKKYNIMRKYYVEKYSFYRLLEDLNSLPFGACSTPLYYNKRFGFIDVYVIFMQDEISPPDKPDAPKKTQIGAFFYRKPKDVRRSSQVVPICQVWFDLSEIVELVLCPQVRFVDDLLNALGNKYIEIYTCLDDACHYDTQF